MDSYVNTRVICDCLTQKEALIYIEEATEKLSQ